MDCMKNLVILLLLTQINVFAADDVVCTKCIKGEQSCQRREGQLLHSRFLRKCEIPKTIDDYCTPCIKRSGDDPSKGIRVQEVGTKWISYYVKSKGESQAERMWCGTKDHSCDEVLKVCEQARKSNPECHGQSAASGLNGSGTN